MCLNYAERILALLALPADLGDASLGDFCHAGAGRRDAQRDESEDTIPASIEDAAGPSD
jgi:hypothetical protein